VKRLENGHFIPSLREITGNRESCRSGADNGDLLAILGRQLGFLEAALTLPVGEETLHSTNPNRLGLLQFPDDTEALALVLIGANSAAHCGEVVVLLDDIDAALEVTLLYLENESGYVDAHWAAVNTYLPLFAGLTLEASLRLLNDFLRLLAERDFTEVLDPILGRLMVSGAQLIEKTILKNLYRRVEVEFEEKEGYNFSDYIEELRKKS